MDWIQSLVREDSTSHVAWPKSKSKIYVQCNKIYNYWKGEDIYRWHDHIYQKTPNKPNETSELLSPATDQEIKQKYKKSRVFVRYRKKLSNKISSWASLVAQWLRIFLPVQKTLVQSLGPGRSHMPKHPYNRAQAPQLLSSRTREPTFPNKRNHCNEKPAHHN